MYRKLNLFLLLPFLCAFLSTDTVRAQNAGDWWTNAPKGVRTVGYYQFRNHVWGEDEYIVPKHDGVGWQNIWAFWGQNLSWVAWGVDAGHVNGTTSPGRAAGGVKSYPNIARGWVITDGFVTNNHGMGIKVDQLQRANVGWYFESPNSGRHQALVDIYLHWWHSPEKDSAPALNIQLLPHWQDYQGYLNDPNNIGRGNTNTSAYSIGQRWIGDVRYEAWVKWQHPDAHFGTGDRFFHVRPVDFKNGASQKGAVHDVKGIIDWARTHYQLAHPNMYLTGIQAGFELIDGGRDFRTNAYWTDIR